MIGGKLPPAVQKRIYVAGVIIFSTLILWSRIGRTDEQPPPKEPIFALTRVYPYLRPLEVRYPASGGGVVQWTSGIGIGYRLTNTFSVSAEWQEIHADGKQNVLVVTSKLSFR